MPRQRLSEQGGYLDKHLPETIKRRHKLPYGGPSRRIEVVWEKDNSLPSIVSGLSKEAESRPKKSWGRGVYLERSSIKMESTNLNTNPEATEAVVELQKLF
jgi:hypothetical protein